MAQLSRARQRWIAFALAALLGSATLAGQTPAPARGPTRQTVVAGDHYHAGWLHRLLLGTHYRDLWATPLEVDVLDLSRFAGGLTPTGCGGRRQTKVLRRCSTPPASCTRSRTLPSCPTTHASAGSTACRLASSSA